MSDRPKRFAGRHRTTYTFSKPVFLEPHIIRLRPRTDPGQSLRSFGVHIDPAPMGLTGGIDAWGNDVVWTWFAGKHERLVITTTFEADRMRANPYDFVVPAEAARIPPTYADHEMPGLLPYLVTEGSSPTVEQLAKESAAATGGDIVAFLSDLNRRINQRCTTIVRPTGDPFSAEDTLAAAAGSCRDLAVLYVEACRRVNVAARFVSGYVESTDEGEPRELHAWAGVYIPGAGWRGYDPTQGLAVSTGHVRLASAATPKGAAPVTGSIRGDGATSEIAFDIQFDVTDIGTGKT